MASVGILCAYFQYGKRREMDYKANGIDPLRYLIYLLENRPNADMSDDELEQLAPWSEATRKQCANNVE